MVSRILTYTRSITSRFFYLFGHHCAKNTIRVLLISGVVITGLVYPALIIQFSSQPLSQFSTHILDASFLYNRGNAVAPPPVRNIWDNHEAFRVRADATSLARCERTVSVERLFVRGGPPNNYDLLTGPNMHTSLTLHRNILSNLASLAGSPNCIFVDGNTCFSLSPLPLSEMEGLNVLSNNEVTRLVNKPVAAAGIPLHSDFVFSGQTPGESIVIDPEYLVFSYFFRDVDCHSNTHHNTWLQTVKDSAGPTFQTEVSLSLPKLIAIEYDVHGRSGFSLVSALLYITYAIIFVHFSGSLKRMDTVHSRFGLAFTGIVEIIASTMCSISVCAIGGYRITMVPWGILPVVIVFVGAESMFSLVEEVVSTAITLPVKERISIGLSRAGTSTTFKVFSYNCVLGPIAYFATGAIRQFCVFAIVVLVAHWFLIHTMFISVLAIDLHRLELNDVLRQDPTTNLVTPAPSPKSQLKNIKPETTASGKLQSLLRGRAATNGSLLLMLAMTGALYYHTYSFPNRDDLDSRPTIRQRSGFNSTPYVDLPSAKSDHTDARIWNLLNPDNDPLLHVRIEPPTFVTIQPPAGSFGPTSSERRHSRLSLRVIMPLFRLTTIVIVPIWITNFLLYLLLRYLLKDADLVDAQRHREEGDGSTKLSSSLGDTVSFSVLDRASAHDVVLVASSRDSSIIASVSVGQELSVWFDHEGNHITIDCAAALSRVSVPVRISALAVDDSGSYCAVGSTSGSIAVWSLVKGLAVLQSRTHCTPAAGISQLLFLPQSSSRSPGRLRSPSQGSVRSVPSISLFVTRRDGSVADWPFLSSDIPLEVRQSSSAGDIAHVIGSNPLTKDVKIAVASTQNLVQMISSSSGSGSWEIDDDFQVGEDHDPIESLRADCVRVGDRCITVITSVAESSRINLTDADTGEAITSIDDILSPISQVRIASLNHRTCANCKEYESDSFLVAASSQDSVHLYRVTFPSEGKRCCCSVQNLLGSQSPRVGGSLSRRASSVSFTGTPTRPRNTSSPPESNSPANGAAKYPMYGHGVHSRREKLRNGINDMTENGSTEQLPAQLFPVPLPAVASVTSSPTLFPDTSRISKRVIKTAVIPCERGSWDICGHVVTGVRRRARPSRDRNGLAKASWSSSNALTPSTPLSNRRQTNLTEGILERWEIWTADASGSVRSSRLIDLSTEDDTEIIRGHNRSRSSSKSNSFFQSFPPISDSFFL